MSLAGGVLTGLGENRVAFRLPRGRGRGRRRAPGERRPCGRDLPRDGAGEPDGRRAGGPGGRGVGDGRSRSSCSPNRCSARGWSGRGCRLPSSGRSCRSRRSSCRAASTSLRATSGALRDGSPARCGNCFPFRTVRTRFPDRGKRRGCGEHVYAAPAAGRRRPRLGQARHSPGRARYSMVHTESFAPRGATAGETGPWRGCASPRLVRFPGPNALRGGKTPHGWAGASASEEQMLQCDHLTADC
jgi:hypothetical protein